MITAGIAVLWALIWASAFVATKLALHDAAAPVIVVTRCLVAGVLLLAATAPRAGRPHPSRLGRLALLGVLNYSLYLGLMAYALPLISVGTAAILSASTPLLVACVSVVRGTDQLNPLRAVGLTLGFAGIIVTSLSRVASTDQIGGVLLGAVAVIALAAGTLLTPELSAGVSVAVATGWQALAGGVVLVIPAIVESPTVVPSWQLTGLLSFLALVATVLGMTLWLTLIRRVGACNASLAQFMPPLFGLFLGWLLLDESVNWIELTAAPFVALGVVLAVRRAPAELTTAELQLLSEGGLSPEGDI